MTFNKKYPTKPQHDIDQPKKPAPKPEPKYEKYEPEPDKDDIKPEDVK